MFGSHCFYIELPIYLLCISFECLYALICCIPGSPILDENKGSINQLFISNIYNVGPRIKPWGMPDNISEDSGIPSSPLMHWTRVLR